MLIGSGAIVPGAESSLAEVFGKHRDVWMGVKVSSDPEMTPRSRITSAGYAIKAGRIDPEWLEAFMATADYDGDGHTKMFSGGDDCNDSESSTYPGAPEVYGDGIDQDCDGRDPDRFLIDPHLQPGNQSASPGITSRITVAWETATPPNGRDRIPPDQPG